MGPRARGRGRRRGGATAPAYLRPPPPPGRAVFDPSLRRAGDLVAERRVGDAG
jgi:hypothetical protein